MSVLVQQQEWGLHSYSPLQTFIQQGIECIIGNNPENNKDHLNANGAMKDNQKWIFCAIEGVRREQELAGLILFTEKYFNYDLQVYRNSGPLEKNSYSRWKYEIKKLFENLLW